MELNRWPNLVTMFFEQADTKGDSAFLWKKRDGKWQSVSWGEAAQQTQLIAVALKEYGLIAGDRVVLVGENSPEWAIADFAIMAAGGITVPTYTTNTSSDHRHILSDSGATIAIVSNKNLAEPLLDAAAGIHTLTRIITIEEIEATQNSRPVITPWHEALQQGDQAKERHLLDIQKIGQDDLACIIYTSGTGGTPKGVMLSHRSILCNCVGAFHLLLELGLDDEVFLSFLPLSHSYEHSCGLMFPTAIGAQIYYAEGIEKLADEDLQIGLAISLHAPNNELRKKLVPTATRDSVKEIIDAGHYYFKKTGRRVTFEYALMEGVNDSRDTAHELAELLRGNGSHVNLIPINPTAGDFKRPSKSRVFEFKRILNEAGVNCTIRIEKGTEISAACGQLRTDIVQIK